MLTSGRDANSFSGGERAINKPAQPPTFFSIMQKQALKWHLLATMLFAVFQLTLSAKEGKTLIDFGDVREDVNPNGTVTALHAYDHVWGDWEKCTRDLRRKGVLIDCAKNGGTLGKDRSSLRFGNFNTLLLTYVVGDRNKANHITFKLTDADGSEAEWDIPLATAKPQVLSVAALDLSHPGSLKGGKVAGLDTSRIVNWEFHGDWSETRVEVLLVKVLGAAP